MTTRRIFLVAGEPSGDQLGSGVICLLKSYYPDVVLEGIGGKEMIGAGLKSLYPIENLSVMGIKEVLKHLLTILKIRNSIIHYCLKNPPDIYIGIDSPDFNLPVEAKLRAQGIKTAHYVSPSVWAWREWRIKKIKASTDVVFTILPFESNFYKKHQHKAVFVGHPLAKRISMHENIKEARERLSISLNENKKVLAVLPGSRVQEVKRILPVFLQSILQLKHRGYVFDTLLPVANNNLYSSINKYRKITDKLKIRILDSSSRTILQASDFVLVASGTATLEAMMYKKPMVIGYQVSKFTAAIVKHMLKTDFFGLPNILAGKEIVPEFIQGNFTADHCSQALQKFFTDPDHVKNIKAVFQGLHASLRIDSDYKVVKEIMNLLAQ